MSNLLDGYRKALALLTGLICIFSTSLFAQMSLDSAMVEHDSLGIPRRIKGQVIVKFKLDALNQAMLSDLDTEHGGPELFLKGEAHNAIETLTNAGFYKAERIFKRLQPEAAHSIARDGELIPFPEFYCYFLLYYDSPESPVTVSSSLSELSEILWFAEPNGLGFLTFVPNDPEFTNQSSINPYAAINYPDGHVNAVAAWDLEKGKDFIKVGVYDTGIDWVHPDFGNGTLQNNVIKGGWDFTRNLSITQLNPSPAPFSVYGNQYFHGTRVAGIIGARTNNNVGISGIAGGDAANQQQGIQLFSMQMIRQYMAEENLMVISMNQWAPAIVEGASWDPVTGYGYGLHLMNHSWVTDFPYQSLKEAIGFAWVNQCVTVASRGNYSQRNPPVPTIDTKLYPACFRDEWVLNIGGSGTDGMIKRFGVGLPGDDPDIEFESMYGEGVDLIAPSTKLMVMTTSHATPNQNNGYTYGYDRFNGTSAAAPHVSGAAALLMSYFNVPSGNTFSKSLYPEDIEYILEHSTTQRSLNTNIFGYSPTDGWGLLQINQALQYIEKPKFDILHYDATGYDSLVLVSDSSYALTLPIEGRSVYRVRKYKLYKTISHSLAPGQQIRNHWARHSRSLAYDDSGLNHFHPWVEFTAPPTANAVQMQGYVYQVIYDHLAMSPLNSWYPGPPAAARFAYSLRVEQLPVGQSAPTQPAAQLQAFPNPASDHISLRYQVLQAGTYHLQLIDLHGKIHQERTLGQHAPRFYETKIDCQNLPAGIYTLRLSNGTTFAHKKISIMHH